MRDNQGKRVSKMKRTLSLQLIALMLSLTASAQQRTFSVMFYNTENLFDTVDDTLKDDDEFLPGGTRHWTKSRYSKKTDCISRAIIAAGGWDAPAVAGLCEVENESVVKDLVNSEILGGIDYSFIHYDSPDRRGIDLCLFCRRDIVTVLGAESWLPRTAGSKTAFDSRNVLFVKTRIYGDTISFVVCHWPSQRGGLLASEEQRRLISDMVMHKIDSVEKTTGPGAKIILMGDFNCSPDFKEIRKIEEHCGMINLSGGYTGVAKGSYKFRGRWEMMDQILISGNLTVPAVPGCKKYDVSFVVAANDFLLEDDPDYPGKRPFSTYRDYRWCGGYSDHLPVLLRLTSAD
mgnify:CR=1 FL=1